MQSTKRVLVAIAGGNSIIVLGEAGSKTNPIIAVHEEILEEYNRAIATYKGSIKNSLWRSQSLESPKQLMSVVKFLWVR